MIRTRIAWFLAVVPLAAVSPLAAQTCATNPCTVVNTASATVNDMLRLTLSSTTTDLGTPTESDFDAGRKDASGPTATVKSNRPWHVSVVGNTSNFSYTGSLTDPNKPRTDLLWGTAAGTYSNNMGTAANLFSGNATASSTQQIFYRTNWSYASDVPGTYSLAVNFTLSAP